MSLGWVVACRMGASWSRWCPAAIGCLWVIGALQVGVFGIGCALQGVDAPVVDGALQEMCAL